MMNKVAFFHILAISLFLYVCPVYAGGGNGTGSLGLKTVVIDPGHGGKDPGAVAKGKKVHEKHIVLSVSKLLGAKIQKAYPDVKVIYTRSNDTFIGLHDRAMVARRNNADLFISIHCNSSESKAAYGSSVHILGQKSDRKSNQTDYFEKNMSVAQQENAVIVLEDDYQTKYQDYDPDSPESFISHKLQWTAYYESSLLFASEVVDKLVKAPLTPRKAVIDQDVFQVLWTTNMPSVLLELAFISNAREYAYLASADGQEEIAQRLFEAFSSYKAKYDASLDVSEPAAQTPSVSSPPESSAPSFYGIQIMGLGRRLENGDPALKGLKCKAVKGEDSNIYKYVTAESRTRSEAENQLAAVRKKFPEAFVVKVTGTVVERIR